MASTLPPAELARQRALPEKATGFAAKADLRSPEPNRQLIGKAIARARELRGWSLKEFAGHCQRDERQIHRWQTGDERPQFDVLFAIPGFRPYLILAFAQVAGEGVDVTAHITVRIA